MIRDIRGRFLRATQHAVNAGESAAPDGDLTDKDIQDLEVVAKFFRTQKRNVVLVPVTPAEARALVSALDNSLRDGDYRKDWMTARQRKLADGLAAKLDAVGYRRQ